MKRAQQKKSRATKAKKKTLKERAFERINISKELKKLQGMIEELRLDYEQYFLGITPFRPDKLHGEVKRLIRKIRMAPFKRQAQKYKQLTLESRFQTYNDYWQRIIRQKEEGTYSKDVFKANLRERHALEDQEAETEKGAVSRNMQALFNSYKRALEQQTGRKQELDLKAFRKSILKRAKAYRQKYGDKKLSFKVVVKKGKVSIKAKAGTSKKSATGK